MLNFGDDLPTGPIKKSVHTEGQRQTKSRLCGIGVQLLSDRIPGLDGSQDAAKASLPYEKAKLLPMAVPMAEVPLIPRPGYPGDISNHPLREGLLAAEAAGNR